jgi:addiction module RelE/StbE family toxin
MPDLTKVFWTTTGLNDLKKIVIYIAADSKERAALIFEKMKAKAEKLSGMPLQGRIVPELQFYQVETFRELIESPWRIVYKIEENKVYILSVIDGRRNIEDILIDRFM